MGEELKILKTATLPDRVVLNILIFIDDYIQCCNNKQNKAWKKEWKFKIFKSSELTKNFKKNVYFPSKEFFEKIQL